MSHRCLGSASIILLFEIACFLDLVCFLDLTCLYETSNSSEKSVWVPASDLGEGLEQNLLLYYLRTLLL